MNWQPSYPVDIANNNSRSLIDITNLSLTQKFSGKYERAKDETQQEEDEGALRVVNGEYW